jgi:hypothetical protein
MWRYIWTSPVKSKASYSACNPEFSLVCFFLLSINSAYLHTIFSVCQAMCYSLGPEVSSSAPLNRIQQAVLHSSHTRSHETCSNQGSVHQPIPHRAAFFATTATTHDRSAL